jgi:serine/threonine protein kinase
MRSRFLLNVLNADVVRDLDVRFIVTQVVAMGDLEAAAAQQGLSMSRAVRLIQQTAAGLDRIHAAGMVHRDVTPGNVLLDGDVALLADLEFCELLDGLGRAGRTGSWCTVAPEAAPEVGGYCSIVGDVYSLAAPAFYALSGEYPVDHRLDIRNQLARIEVGDLRDLRTLAPHVPQGVSTVVRAGLRLDPLKRIQTPLDFSNALAHAARALATGGVRTTLVTGCVWWAIPTDRRTKSGSAASTMAIASLLPPGTPPVEESPRSPTRV